MRAHRSRSRRATAARVVWARPTTRPPPPVPFKGQAGPRFGGLGLCGRGRLFCSSLRPSRRGQRDPLPHGDLPQVPARWAGPQLRVSGVSAALGRGARCDSGLIAGCAASCPPLLPCWGFPQLIRGGSWGQRRWLSAARWVKLCRSESLLFVKLLE